LGHLGCAGTLAPVTLLPPLPDDSKDQRKSLSSRVSDLFGGAGPSDRGPRQVRPLPPQADGPTDQRRSLLGRVSDLFGGAGLEDRDPQQVIPPEERKAAMSSLDRTEHKLALGGLVLATLAGIGVPLWVVSQNRVDKAGKNSVAVAPDAWLLMAAILVFCLIGFIALWKGKRTLVTFSLFLIGFGFTLFVGVIGFAFILLGGWLMLRAWRLNKYGSTNAKVVAREAAAARPPKGERGSRARTKEPVKTVSKSGGARKPPTASKRYTPKAPPRRKVPKPTE
jgi:hypothetical protein